MVPFGAAGVLYHVATDSVLLHHRDAGAPVYASCWHTFGGHSEPEDGGDPLATWRRELREELGVEVPAAGIRPLFEDEVAPGRVVHVFYAEWPERSEDFVLGEGDGFAWFPLAAALELADLSERARDRLWRLRDRLRPPAPAPPAGGASPSPTPPAALAALAALASEEGDEHRDAYQDVTAALRAAYDRGAGERERGEVAPWKREERQRYLDALRAAGARTLLEVGAGTGKDALFFREHGLDVTCTDLSPAMVALCRAKGLRAEVRDVLRLGFPPASFDAVYTLNCLLHVPRRALPAALGAVRAVLRPGGLCYLGLYGGRDSEGVWPDDHHDPRRFFSFHTDAGLRRAVAPHFDLLDFRAVPVSRSGASGLHFQALLLRRPPVDPEVGDGAGRPPPGRP